MTGYLLDTNAPSAYATGDLVSVNTADGLIAATAIEHGLTIVTRNEKHFTGVGGTVCNPWKL